MIFQKIKRERRKEKRHYCSWPIWFATSGNERFLYGDIVDLSSDFLSLICTNNTKLLQTGSRVKIHFGYSYVDFTKSGGVEMFSCPGNICRIESVGRKFLRRTNRIAIKLSKPLPFTPCQIEALNVILEVLQKSEVKGQLNFVR